MSSPWIPGAADELDAWLMAHGRELRRALEATAPQPGSHLADLLASPDPEGRVRGVLAWLQDAVGRARQ